MANSMAEIQMQVGVKLRTQIVNAEGAPSGGVHTGGALRADAVNLGIISFIAEMSTDVIGDSVTDYNGSSNWITHLMLPGSPEAKSADQKDTQLRVVRPGNRVAFRTIGTLFRLGDDLTNGDRSSTEAAHYKSKPLDVFGTTAQLPQNG
jgi:hypothetical protein